MVQCASTSKSLRRVTRYRTRLAFTVSCLEAPLTARTCAIFVGAAYLFVIWPCWQNIYCNLH
jgi:hypothetical protein